MTYGNAFGTPAEAFANFPADLLDYYSAVAAA
jgi:hypothetical protein